MFLMQFSRLHYKGLGDHPREAYSGAKGMLSFAATVEYK